MVADDGDFRDTLSLHTLLFLRAKTLSRGLRPHAWLTFPLVASCVYALLVAASDGHDRCAGSDDDNHNKRIIELGILSWLALHCGIAVYLSGDTGWFEVLAVGVSVFAVVSRPDALTAVRGNVLETCGEHFLFWGWCTKLIYHLFALIATCTGLFPQLD